MTQSTRLYGLSIASEIDLPELPFLDPAGATDLRVRRGAVAIGGQVVERREEGLCLSIDGVARFLIRGGTEIRVDEEVGADPRDLRIFLTGSAMGLALLQRGRIALHANAVVVDGAAWLFCGPSGAGKSTLAAWFARAGHDVLADDVAAIAWRDDRPFAVAGPPRVRLWDDAIRAAGDDPSRHPLSFPSQGDIDKRDVAMGRCAADEIPLGAVILLADGPMAWRAVRGMEAARLVLENLYRGEWLAISGQEAAILAAAARLAASVPVLSLTRPRDHDRIGDALPFLRDALNT